MVDYSDMTDEEARKAIRKYVDQGLVLNHGNDTYSVTEAGIDQVLRNLLDAVAADWGKSAVVAFIVDDEIERSYQKSRKELEDLGVNTDDLP